MGPGICFEISHATSYLTGLLTRCNPGGALSQPDALSIALPTMPIAVTLRQLLTLENRITRLDPVWSSYCRTQLNLTGFVSRMFSVVQCFAVV